MSGIKRLSGITISECEEKLRVLGKSSEWSVKLEP